MRRGCSPPRPHGLPHGANGARRLRRQLAVCPHATLAKNRTGERKSVYTRGCSRGPLARKLLGRNHAIAKFQFSSFRAAIPGKVASAPHRGAFWRPRGHALPATRQSLPRLSPGPAVPKLPSEPHAWSCPRHALSTHSALRSRGVHAVATDPNLREPAHNLRDRLAYRAGCAALCDKDLRARLREPAR